MRGTGNNAASRSLKKQTTDPDEAPLTPNDPCDKRQAKTMATMETHRLQQPILHAGQGKTTNDDGAYAKKMENMFQIMRMKTAEGMKNKLEKFTTVWEARVDDERRE